VLGAWKKQVAADTAISSNNRIATVLLEERTIAGSGLLNPVSFATMPGNR
jgi:hypothetical protein